MRTYILCLCLTCGACAPQYTETRLAPGEPTPTNQALFSEPPELLHQAFEDACQGPLDEYAAFGAKGARCRTIPPPDIAYQLLLRFDAALDLPRIVVERETLQADSGVVESFGYFASVPLKSGQEQRVYLRSKRLDKDIEDMFRAFGGEPISTD